jgi:hypothetical protein
MTGRPPTGVRPGERLTDYKQVTVRLPPDTVGQLEALARTLEQPQWRVVTEAITALASAHQTADQPDPTLIEGALAIARRAAKRPQRKTRGTDHDLYDDRGLPA